MTVDLVYDEGCPNVSAARAQLLRAFAEAGITARWREWLESDPDAPDYVGGYGSPSILVAGEEVTGAMPVPDLRGCRVYLDAGAEPSTRGAPPMDCLVAALRAAADSPTSSKDARFGSGAACPVEPQPTGATP